MKASSLVTPSDPQEPAVSVTTVRKRRVNRAFPEIGIYPRDINLKAARKIRFQLLPDKKLEIRESII